ncbi:unnamed protein product [Brachionus calyciflorus]|uniref:Uncharacterized protein n=1 Tax=Brachionus calyciflorus TaxID=104777 RepID=A0A813RH29_9BILA|nr:unnamed protein product [Brachionus calyciflorus]
MNLRTKIANRRNFRKKSIQELNDSQEKTPKISISSEACGYKNSSISSEARSSSSKASGSGSLCEASSSTQFTQTKYSLSSISNKYFVYKFGEHNWSITGLKKTRGINVTVKNSIKTILDEDKDIIPSCILDRSINVHNIPQICIPSLKQIQNYVQEFSSVLDIVKEH